MILSRMGRWYEGPSLAEEDAAAESVAEEAAAEPEPGPTVLPSDPLEIEPMADSVVPEAPPEEAPGEDVVEEPAIAPAPDGGEEPPAEAP